MYTAAAAGTAVNIADTGIAAEAAGGGTGVGVVDWNSFHDDLDLFAERLHIAEAAVLAVVVNGDAGDGT